MNTVPHFEHVSQKRALCRTNVVLIGTLLVLIVCGWLVPAFAQTVAGTVTKLKGSASVRRAGSTMDVTLGMSVEVADQIAVAAGGKVTVTLSDRSLLEAGPSSIIVIDQQLLGAGGARSSTRVSMLAGILRSVVKHSSYGNPPNFEVHTPNAILAARSTMFDTSYTQGEQRFGYGECNQFTDVQTYKGSVGVRNAANPEAAETSVGAGYETTVACDSSPQSPGPLGMTGIPSHGISALSETEPGAVIAPPPAAPVVPSFAPVVK
jgi:FecR protein